MRLSDAPPARSWWCAPSRTSRPLAGLPGKEEEEEEVDKRPDGAISPARRRGDGRAHERRGSTEAQDAYGTRVRLTWEGLAYGGQFVAFDEMDDKRPVSHSLWNPATSLFEVAVFRRHGPQLIVKNLLLSTADRLRKEIIDALRERRS